MRRPLLPWRATLTLTVLALLLTSVLMVIAQGDGGTADEPEITEEADLLRSVAGGSVYTARIGDTFWTLAERYNVSLIALMQANSDIHPNRILVGDEIFIPDDAPPYNVFPALSYPFLLTPMPGATPYAVPPIGPGDRLYIIQPRDVLDLLGALLDVQVMCIIEYNNITDPVRIYPGQPIVIPGNCPSYDGLSTAVPPWAPDLNAGFGAVEGGGGRPQTGGNQQQPQGDDEGPVEATPTFTPTLVPSSTPTVPATPVPQITATQAATTPAVPPTRPPTVTPTPQITATATG